MTSSNKNTHLHENAERVKELLGSRVLVLVGLMGAGKSTIGKKIATMLGLAFKDGDNEIEGASRMSVTELFESYGEVEFRDLERRVILRLLEAGPMVLATGGGAYMNAETRQSIADHGISLWLDAELDVLMERVSRRQNRPLLKNADPRGVMSRLIDERYPVYAQANLRFMSREDRKDVIASEVIDLLLEHLEAEKN
ncbi:shikimate kinase [Paenochrobactrum sp. BZR 588]|uniref:shikimate kinase n=1 Tax=Paenochrobactrum TaxID=999488 RepID=UPI0035BC32CC